MHFVGMLLSTDAVSSNSFLLPLIVVHLPRNPPFYFKKRGLVGGCYCAIAPL